MGTLKGRLMDSFSFSILAMPFPAPIRVFHSAELPFNRKYWLVLLARGVSRNIY